MRKEDGHQEIWVLSGAQHISCAILVNSGVLNDIMWFKIFSENVEGCRGSIKTKLKANKVPIFQSREHVPYIVT